MVYKVENVRVFGSYLSDQEILGDIDVAVKLEKKVSCDQFITKSEERIKLAHKNGKTFSNFIDQLYWPCREVMLHLGTRKKGLNLHYDGEDEVLNRIESKTVFQL